MLTEQLSNLGILFAAMPRMEFDPRHSSHVRPRPLPVIDGSIARRVMYRARYRGPVTGGPPQLIRGIHLRATFDRQPHDINVSLGRRSL
jgi:hypothetical protein